jgi:hypothetical protein
MDAATTLSTDARAVDAADLEALGVGVELTGLGEPAEPLAWIPVPFPGIVGRTSLMSSVEDELVPLGEAVPLDAGWVDMGGGVDEPGGGGNSVGPAVLLGMLVPDVGACAEHEVTMATTSTTRLASVRRTMFVETIAVKKWGRRSWNRLGLGGRKQE